METTYEQDITIDKFALDEEWLKQPRLYKKWSDKYTQAVYERDRIWQKRKVVRAELDAEIRLQLDKQGKKSTDTIIDSLIRKNERHQKVSEELIEANKNMNILEGAKWGMEHKKKALEEEVQLFLSNYWADREPNIPKEAKEQAQSRTSDQIKRGLSRSTRLRSRRDG